MRFLPLLLLTGCGLLDLVEPEPSPVDVAPVAVSTDVPASFAAFDAAPPLVVDEWVKGEPVSFEGDGIVLVEQWATWCGPCKEQIPHLTELQHTHADRLTIVGVSDEAGPTVSSFVQRKGDEMDYTVARTSSTANAAWFDYANNDAIPYGFLVQHGRVLWHGHPNAMDAVLGAILEGSWTHDDLVEVQGIREQTAAYLSGAMSGMPDAALGARLAESRWLDANEGNNLAWAILTDVPATSRDVELAVRLSEKVGEQTSHGSWVYEDTLGLALFEAGRSEEAISVQANAVALCEQDDAGSACAELSERLEHFRQAAAG